MIKIGLVDIDVSHPKAFSAKMDELSLPMNYTGIVNYGFREEDEVEAFAKARGAKVYKTIEEMLPEVDAGFIQSCNWDKHLAYAMPFIEAGKPVFIDKPMVGSVAEVRRIRELAANGAKILGSSAMRYAPEVDAYLAGLAAKGGKVMNVLVTCGIDEFNYGIHAGEILSRIAGAPAETCRYAGKSADIDGNTVETYFVTFKNGISATYAICSPIHQTFELSIMSTKGAECFRLAPLDSYSAMLSGISEALQGKESPIVDVDTITDAILMMLAGKLSREQGGVVVRVDELPEDLAFDGAAFEKGYAAAAQKIYL